MVLAHAPRHGDAQQLFEEQHDVPVEFCRALHVAAFPRLLHEDRHCPAGHEALALQIPLVAHHQDWHLIAAALPAGARGRCEEKMNEWTKHGGSVVTLVPHLPACVQDACEQFPPSFNLRCAGADERITAHRLEGPPTTRCSGCATALLQV